MNSIWSRTAIWPAVAAACTLLTALPASFAQAPEPPSGTPETQQAASLLSPDQLNALVAPVALYPDPLLSQVLAASTYPLEIVEAHQWLGENGNLRRAQLMEAARRQNWDPSVQALVAFPNALTLLATHVRWTTDLGNAFLAQPADVMSAVQTMRAEARAKGRLTSTPQQSVTADDQNSIAILPADPQVIYVPIYRPAYIWGPPVWGAYADLWYPAGYSFGFGFGPGIYMSAFFPRWTGWGGWGWGCAWHGRSLYLNSVFFNRYGYRGGYFGHFGGYSGRGYVGRAAWTHDPGHRLGIPYPNRTMASRFHSTRFGSSRFGGDRTSAGRWNGTRFDAGRPAAAHFNRGEWRHFGDGNRFPSAGGSGERGYGRSADPGFRSSNRGAAPAQSYRGSGSAQAYRNSPSMGRSFSPRDSAPRGGGASAPRSAPRSPAGQRASGGSSRSSGGHSGASGHSGRGGHRR